ncbi:unnamed protein product [Heligmosomoides polygyrus]|uniref:BACK domain-containing protein n=1 Tax=Heligmosomoides polygyrus TaxID=6339 RepID=A0A183FJX5_HELPZ|nr:unnamed protein product [Heligmosomoides polygyrus]
MQLFDHIQTLYEEELYEDLVFLHEMVPNWDSLDTKNEALMAVYVADAYFELEKYSLSLLVSSWYKVNCVTPT